MVFGIERRENGKRKEAEERGEVPYSGGEGIPQEAGEKYQNPSFPKVNHGSLGCERHDRVGNSTANGETLVGRWRWVAWGPQSLISRLWALL